MFIAVITKIKNHHDYNTIITLKPNIIMIMKNKTAGTHVMIVAAIVIKMS